jgi:hypothetical protein
MYYEIDEQAARRAKEANSFSDYIPGSATESYHSYVDKATEIAEAQKAKVDPMYYDKIDHLLDRYARKLAENLNQSNRIDARVPSIMIAGGSNFPVRAKEKQNAARGHNMEEFNYIQGLLDKIRSTGTGGISSDDPEAVQKLKSKLEALEADQKLMKDVNAYFRKHGSLEGCPLLNEDAMKRLQADMNSSWRTDPRPFESWALSNNNANIKRVCDRIAELESRKEQPPAGWTFDGGSVVASQEENRLQIFFDEKPDDELRWELKSRGFRWAPSQGAWQRQLTKNAVYAARQIKQIGGNSHV